MLSFRSDPCLSPQDVCALENIVSKARQGLSVPLFSQLIRQYIISSKPPFCQTKLLGFFLKCEKRIIHHNDSEWRVVLNEEVNRLKGMQRITQIYKQFQLRRAMLKLKVLKGKQTNKKEHILSFHNLITVESQIQDSYEDIEVSQEIRIMTKYFFKWCRYVDNVKLIRKKRLRDIDNLHKSLSFNQYAIKFNCFSVWSALCKAKKQARQRSQAIKAKGKQRLCHMVLASISEKYQIREVQGLLENIVSKCLILHLKRQVFRRLQTNSQMEKKKYGQNNNNKYELKVKHNAWAHRFISFLGNNIEVIKSKSATQCRDRHQHMYARICLIKAYSILQEHRNSTKAKKDSVATVIKVNQLRCLICISKRAILLQRKSLLWGRQMNKEKKILYLTLLKACYKRSQTRKEQKRQENKLNANYLVANAKLSNLLLGFRCRRKMALKRSGLEALLGYRSNVQEEAQRYFSLKCIFIRGFFKQLIRLRIRRIATQNTYNELDQFNKRKVISKYLYGLKANIPIRKVQKSVAAVIESKLSIKLLKKSFTSIKYQQKKSRILSQLCVISQKAILRLIMNKIFKKSKTIILEVSRMLKNYQNKLKKQLINVLITNIKIKEQKVQLVFYKLTYFNQCKLISKLKNKYRIILNFNQKCRKTKSLLGVRILRGIQEANQRVKALSYKAQILLKTLTLKSYADQHHLKAAAIQQENSHIAKITEVLMKINFQQMMARWNIIRRDHTNAVLKFLKAKKVLVKASFQVFWGNISYFTGKSQMNLNEKMKIIQCIICSQSLKILVEENRRKKIEKCRANQDRRQCLKQLELHLKAKKIMYNLKMQVIKKSISLFASQCKRQIDIWKEKLNKIALNKKQSQKKTILEFFKVISIQANLNTNKSKLFNRLLQTKFVRAVRQHMAKKYKKVRELFSIRHYAQTLKTKAINSFKKHHSHQASKENWLKVNTRQNQPRSQGRVQTAQSKVSLSDVIARVSLRRSKQVL